MTRSALIEQIRSKQSYLCVGLDTDPEKIPRSLRTSDDPVFEFNKRIIDATLDHCIAYKLNTAFYEVSGATGWKSMQKTVEYIPSTHFKIADAKRGDIGNTSTLYARAFFETLSFDAVTVTPYMGEDSIRPFLAYPDKWTILLGLTSNDGAADFELQPGANGLLYESVIQKASQWGTTENLMFVIGATKPEWFDRIRAIAPNHFYLVPGLGAQGGSLKEISKKALNKDVGILVNASRAIIYAGTGDDFAEKASEIASGYASEMSVYLKSNASV
ncbi:MAG TPA: orotidine-5'-phosphate decarboxylase [Puia sp.]|nr:orotidine-5'-phosphate decarboxylase [Puia sp.]